METVPMKYHRPGWSVDHPNGDLFQLWAPQDEPGHEGSTSPLRNYFQVAWQNEDGERGNCIRSDSYEGALKALDDYPDQTIADDVANLFTAKLMGEGIISV